jgi:hydrogenase maturation protease
MGEEAPGLLILGLGNVLLADDGLGIAAVARLAARYDLPSDVQAVDGGTLGLSLLPLLTSARDVILVDAVATDAAAGTLVRLAGDEVPGAVRHRLSPHQVGVADLLDGARLLDRFPGRLVLLGLVPASLALAVARSPAVEERLDALVEAVAAETRSLGYGCPRRSNDAPTLDGSFAGARRLFGL